MESSPLPPDFLRRHRRFRTGRMTCIMLIINGNQASWELKVDLTLAFPGREPAIVPLRYVVHPQGPIDDLKPEDLPKALPVSQGHLGNLALQHM